MRHRDMEFIAADVLADGLARTPLSHHIIWTGREPRGQPGSLRLRALACLPRSGEPVGLRLLIQRAARLDGLSGLHPDAVRGAVRLHQVAKPAVFLLAERRASGDFVAVTDIPFAGALDRQVRAGQVLIDHRGARTFDLLDEAA